MNQFDPGSQLTMQLIQSLGQQIGAGVQSGTDRNILSQILPQAEQAQDPNAILDSILQLQQAPGLSPQARQETTQNLQNRAQLQQQRQLQESRLLLEAAKAQQKEQKDLVEADIEATRRDALAKYIASQDPNAKEEDLQNLTVRALENMVARGATTKSRNEQEIFKTNNKFFSELQKNRDKYFVQRQALDAARQAGNNINVWTTNLKQKAGLTGPDTQVLKAATGLMLGTFSDQFKGTLNKNEFDFIVDSVVRPDTPQTTKNAFFDFYGNMLAAGESLPAAALQEIDQDPASLESPQFISQVNRRAELIFQDLIQQKNNLIRMINNPARAGQPETQPPEVLPNAGSPPTPQGKVRVIAPDGRTGFIPQNQLDSAQQQGFRLAQ